METGIRIRPVQTPPIALARPEPAVERQVVRTELPETQSVQATAAVQDGNSARIQQRNIVAELNTAIDTRRSEPQRRVTQDETTKELVFTSVNPETGVVISQFPDEAILRQRAYMEQMRRDAEATEKPAKAYV